MKPLRLALATSAAAALLAMGALVAFAAPSAVTRAASATGGAAHAVYCPDKAARRSRLAAFVRTMAAARKKFFQTHRSQKQRTAFLKAQQAQLSALQRAVAQCS